MILTLLRQSSFYDAVMREGVVVKLDGEEWLRDKGKVVREDFICGNEHWSKGLLRGMQFWVGGLANKLYSRGRMPREWGKSSCKTTNVSI